MILVRALLAGEQVVRQHARPPGGPSMSASSVLPDLSIPGGHIHRDPSNLRLHAYRLSGVPSDRRAFRETLPTAQQNPAVVDS